MLDQEKKITLLFTLYLALGSISIVRFIYILREALDNQDFLNLGIFAFSFLIAGILLIFASYNLLKNKWDPKFIGLACCLTLIVLDIITVYELIIINNREIIRMTSIIFILVTSIVTLIVTLVFWKQIKLEKFIKPLFQNKTVTILYSSWVAIGGLSILFFILFISRSIIYYGYYNIWGMFTSILFFIISGIILIFASYSLLKNKTYAKFLGISGVFFSLLALFVSIYSGIVYDKYDTYKISMHVSFFVFSLFAFVLTIYYWKKLP